MQIPKRSGSKWDGESIQYTKDCSDCDYYRTFEKIDYCGWGKAFKLIEIESPKRTCEKLRHRNPPERPSLEYLDEIINKKP